MIPIFEPTLGKAERDNLIEAIDTGWISSQGKFIPLFEQRFAEWNEMKFGVACSNCTTALHLALEVLKIGPGDEVICPDLTFISPANMIKLVGAKAVLVDIERDSWGIDPEKIEEKITKNTKAIIVVHQFGHAANMDPIMEIAESYNLKVIEDVAEAPGAKYKGKLVGTFGDLSCYSFFANKIMTTGEGGMVLTNDQELDRALRILRDHGMSPDKKYVHVVKGFNYRMTNMQAAIGLGQLERLDETISMRDKQDQKYKQLFDTSEYAKYRPNKDWSESVHWLATISVEERFRDPLMKYLLKNGIEARQMVFPVHMASPFEDENKNQLFPEACAVSMSSLHLPSSLNITPDQQNLIVDTLTSWLEDQY